RAPRSARTRPAPPAAQARRRCWSRCCRSSPRPRAQPRTSSRSSQHCDSQGRRLQGRFRSDTPCGWAVAPEPGRRLRRLSVSARSLEGPHPPVPGRLSVDIDGRVSVDRLLLRLRVRAAALLRLAALDHALLLTLSTAAGPAPAVTGGLRRSRVLIGLALVPSV